MENLYFEANINKGIYMRQRVPSLTRPEMLGRHIVSTDEIITTKKGSKFFIHVDMWLDLSPSLSSAFYSRPISTFMQDFNMHSNFEHRKKKNWPELSPSPDLSVTALSFSEMIIKIGSHDLSLAMKVNMVWLNLTNETHR